MGQDSFQVFSEGPVRLARFGFCRHPTLFHIVWTTGTTVGIVSELREDRELVADVGPVPKRHLLRRTLGQVDRPDKRILADSLSVHECALGRYTLHDRNNT